MASGIVYNQSIVNSDLFNNHSAENGALYLQADKKIMNKLWISLGGRYELYRIDTVKGNTKPLYRVGLNYEATKSTFIRASYGMGYRIPSIAEKYVSTNVSSVSIIPNPKLLPESGYNIELGAKQLFKIKKTVGMLDVAGFYTRYNNMIEFVFGLASTNFQFHNVANTLIKGVDVSLQTQSTFNKVKLDFNGGFTYSLPKDLGFDTMNKLSKVLAYSDTSKNILKYRYTTSAKFDAEVGWKKFHFGTYVRYNTYTVNIDQSFKFLFSSIDTYTKKWGHKDTWIIDTRFKYDISENASISFIIKNLLNFEYTERPAYIAPPRSFTLQFVYNL